MISYAALREYLPQNVVDDLLDVSTKYGLVSALRLSHFLAQCAHESSNFTKTEENLNYSADGLLKTFPKYFNEDQAKLYARQPFMIANRVYASRMGNGDEVSGDGWRYRGRGYIQLTGHNNYQAFGSTLSDNILLHPDLVASKYALMSAGWFWDRNKLNDIADKGADSETVAAVTRKVNGGYHGLDDRLKLFDRFYGVLNV